MGKDAKKSKRAGSAKAAGRRTGSRQAQAAPHASDRPRLTDLSQVYRYFRSSTRPIYFVSPTPYNVLGIDQWVSGFRYISYFDSFDGAHPHLFSPSHSGPRDFESFESVNTYLLGNKEVVDYINRTGLGQVLFVMFDEETEQMAHEVGLEIALPPLALRQRIDSKVVTTQLGNEAGVPSVPNALGRVSSYEGLLKLAKKHKLGSRLVVQTPYGDSGRTTFFISSRDEFDAHKEVLLDEELKVMKYINHLPGTVEAAATRHGTIVGPIQTDLTGFDELTPYRGGWCGNDIFPTVFEESTRKKIKRMARRLGRRLYAEGYKGVFCMDFLIDTDTGDVYLGEINPRISGASPLTQLITSTYGGVPLFLFHLLEFSDVDWELDLKAIERRWDHHDRWSQLVLKQVSDEIELITSAPPSGLWRMADDGSISYLRSETDWHAVSSYDEAFYLRVYGDGEYRYPGADIGVVVARGRMQTDDRHLLERARQWAAGISQEFRGMPPEEAVTVPNSLLYTKWF
jgi:biotin carboxylase